MQGFYTILLFGRIHIFMTCAWYGHLKVKQLQLVATQEHLPLVGLVLLAGF